jgi:hypothetical protein
LDLVDINNDDIHTQTNEDITVSKQEEIND